MRTAIDTNVLSALWDTEPSALRLTQLLNSCREQGAVVLCAAVYAETLAHPFMSELSLNKFLAETGLRVEFDFDERVWVEAGRRYALYARRRRRSDGSQPKRFLADFLIGAHALLAADRLITLDRGRYERDFPELVLI